MKLHLELANGKTAVAEGTENECANFMSLFEKADSFHQAVADYQPVSSVPEKSDSSERPQKAKGKRGNNSGISDIDGQILSLKSQGLKVPEIAKKLKMTAGAVHNRIFQLKKKGKIAHDTKPGKKKAFDTDELSSTQKRSIKDLCMIDKTPEYIAKTLGITDAQVRQEMKELGLVK